MAATLVPTFQFSGRLRYTLITMSKTYLTSGDLAFAICTYYYNCDATQRYSMHKALNDDKVYYSEGFKNVLGQVDAKV